MEQQTTTGQQMPTYTFTVGKTDNEWSEFGFQQQHLMHEGAKTPYKAIVQRGQLLAIVSKKYRLLPNEIALGAAAEVAGDVGAVPWNEFTGDWYCRVDDNVFYTGRRGVQMHALYAFNEPVDLGGGDTIQLGLSVHNSTDASMGFCVSMFTFRHACANMVFMGFKGEGMGFDDRESLAHIYRRHVGNMTVDKRGLKDVMLGVMKHGAHVIGEYRKLREETLTLERAKRLSEMLPDKYVPEYIKATEERVELLKTDITAWEAYNDVTAKIWHNDKSDYKRKRNLFDKLHKALEVAL